MIKCYGVAAIIDMHSFVDIQSDSSQLADGDDVQPAIEILSLSSSHAAHERKSGKSEYQLLLSELDHLCYTSLYSTIEVGCLGHYLSNSVGALQTIIQQSATTCRIILDKAAQKAICWL